MDYIAYYRVSTKRQGRSGLGLEAQKQSVHDFIKDENLISEYTEIESGTKSHREQLQMALLEAKDTGATLVIARLDRLSRNAAFTFSLMDSKVNFVAVDMPEANELTIGIMALLAQQEAKKISKNTILALMELKKKGVKLGNPRNLTQEARDKSIISRKRKAKYNIYNKRAFAIIKVMRDAKDSLTKIAKYLNDNGFRTSRGANFTPTQINRLIAMYDLP